VNSAQKNNLIFFSYKISQHDVLKHLHLKRVPPSTQLMAVLTASANKPQNHRSS